MKVFILACLVALALARETVESLSSSEESITHINKKLENFQHEEQQQREDERQNKIHPLFQQQPLVSPYADPIHYAILPQNILPLAQPAVVVPFLQPEIMEVPKVKENIFPRHNVMPFLKSPVAPSLDSQILNVADLENMHFPLPLSLPLPLPLLQPLMHQIPQPLPQTPMLTPQSLLSIPQPKVLPFPQQVVPYLQRDMPLQAFLPYQEPTHQAQPVTQPLAPLYNPINIIY
ncbi:beta-casein [Vulpes lagopus]|uniref:beta-casein n=1 Tax=Vulpes lagopus TaxID=494514 RepID=UPI000DF67DED|nr:beta-casein [Vulpes vulpes]XP_041582824.1 beta-casein [Vulpes lagopus]